MHTYSIRPLVTELGEIKSLQFFECYNKALVIGALPSIHLYNLMNFEEIEQFNVHKSVVQDFALDVSHSHMISSDRNGDIFLWNTNQMTNPIPLYGHCGVPKCVTTSRVQPWVACATNLGQACIWDVRNNCVNSTVKIRSLLDFITSIKLSSNELILTNRYGSIQIYDIRSNTNNPRLQIHTNSPIFSSFLINNTNKILLSGNKDYISLINVETGTPVNKFYGSKTGDKKIDCAVTYDNRFVISGSIDGTVKIWPLLGRRRRPHEVHFRFKKPVVHCAVAYKYSAHYLTASGNELQLWKRHRL